jgi:hypothetical protein
MSDEMTTSDTLEAPLGDWAPVGQLAPGFRLARGPKGELRVVGLCIEMTVEAAIEAGFLTLRREEATPIS